jgi:tetratricopeptide (TPR) repeat protein
MAEDEKPEGSSRYKPEGYDEVFPTDMGEISMQVASLIDLGREAYKKESFDLAIKYYNRALDMDPKNEEAKFLKRKTMATLSRLLDGKSKIEDDEDVDKELSKVISKDIDMGSEVKKEEPGDGLKMTTRGPARRPGPPQEQARRYAPPKQDPRKGSRRVYSIPDTDAKFNQQAKQMSYRTGDSFVETKQTRLLLIILALFIIGVLLTSLYFGWLPLPF